jgi:hypothetical protein
MLQYTISLVFQSVRREALACSAQALACRFYFLVRNNIVLYNKNILCTAILHFYGLTCFTDG